MAELDLNVLFQRMLDINHVLVLVSAGLAIGLVLSRRREAVVRVKANTLAFRDRLLSGVSCLKSFRPPLFGVIAAVVLDRGVSAAIAVAAWLQATHPEITFDKGWRYVGPQQLPNAVTVGIFALLLILAYLLGRAAWETLGARLAVLPVLGIALAVLATKVFTQLNCSLGYFRGGTADALSCGLYTLLSPALLGYLCVAPVACFVASAALREPSSPATPRAPVDSAAV